MSSEDKPPFPPGGAMAQGVFAEDGISPRLGEALRNLFADTVEEPLPEDFLLLLARLEAQEQSSDEVE